MRRFNSRSWKRLDEKPKLLTPKELEALRTMPEKFKRIIFRAWALRNQFNGEWDGYYFPAMGQALDIAFRCYDRYPDEGLPASVRRRRRTQ